MMLYSDAQLIQLDKIYNVLNSQQGRRLNGRHHVYAYTGSRDMLVAKFVTLASAYEHVLNTILFRFLKMPFVPCQAYELDLKKAEGLHQHHPEIDEAAVVVMPYVQGRPLLRFSDAGRTALPAYRKMMRHLPAVVAGKCSDVSHANTHEDQKGDVTFLDAEIGLMSVTVTDTRRKLESVEDYAKLHIKRYGCALWAGHNTDGEVARAQKTIRAFASAYRVKTEKELPEPLRRILGTKETLMQRLDEMTRIDLGAVLCP